MRCRTPLGLSITPTHGGFVVVHARGEPGA